MNLQPLMDLIHSRAFGLTALFTLLGIATVVYGFMLRNRGKVVNWVVTDGQLIDCDIIAGAKSRRSTNYKEIFGLFIRYSYSVNGHSYVGENVKVDQRFIPVKDYKQGEQLAKKFNTQTHFMVYYDPFHPSDCTLEIGQREKRNDSAMLYKLGVVCLFLALCFYVGFR
jgi:hypothetical protein